MSYRIPRILICLLIAGCTHGDPGISGQLETALRARPAGPVDLAKIGPPAWERMCVLRPYTNNARAEQVLGFKWDAEGKTSIAGNEGINVLLFTRGREVVAYTEHPRSQGDFSEMRPPCLSRAQASVVREQMSDGWVLLLADQPGMRPGPGELSAGSAPPPSPAAANLHR